MQQRFGIARWLSDAVKDQCPRCAIGDAVGRQLFIERVIGILAVNLMRHAGERRINLPQPLPIHLVYNTIVVGEDGHITRFDDVYGFHRLVRQALEQQGG